MSASSVVEVILVLVASIAVVFYSGKNTYILRKVTEVIHGKPGCLPTPSIGNVTLHYFSVRGKAEPIRMMMVEAGIPYIEKNFNKATWMSNKEAGIKSGLYTYGQVPAIETTTGLKMVQTVAILHYIGRSVGLDCDCEDLHKCESLAHGVEDVRSKLSRMLYDPNFTFTDRDEYLTKTMPKWLGYIEQLAPPLAKQEQAFFYSSRLTWVDFLVFDLLENNIEFAHYDFGSNATYIVGIDVLGQFPRLANFYRHFSGRPGLSSYLRGGKKRFKYTVPNMPKVQPRTEKQ
ncbi:Glutathione S-transferase P 1 [Lamellibrachia satsuma]|nr:Glutathione S-transferase P 1 [Lamellibrachia satsuma]